MKLSQLVAALPLLDTPPQSDPDITLITTDSRKVVPGALFVAYPGVSVDGHRFIPQALERGAMAIVGEQDQTELDQITHYSLLVTLHLVSGLYLIRCG
jgi:UDP-N-acetylmuramoyl-L-alanyl-D-glutamate--2,6-diaminopimelate ligase